MNDKVSPWKYTNLDVSNHWRLASKGHYVVIFPVWLYYDDDVLVMALCAKHNKTTTKHG